MSVAEIRIEVMNKITNTDNEAVLQEVLELLKNATEREKEVVSLSKNYDAIKAQYADVLQKLAQ